jgi:cysteine-rich repeat protein
MSHRWLIAVSMSAHLAAAGGLFAAGTWHLEQLPSPRIHVDLVQQPGPPAPSGGPVAQVKLPEIKPKAHITHDHIQPTTTKPKDVDPNPGSAPGPETPGPVGPGDPDAQGTCTENCGQPAPPPAAVCGNGTVEAGEQCDDGNTVNGDGCSATCRTEVKPRPLAVIAPTAMSALRLTGETQVHPSDMTQQQMMRDGRDTISGTVKLCISTGGSVTSAGMIVPTRYSAYDAALLAAVYGWRYQPYQLNGAAVAACSSVTFVYRLQ